MSGKTDMVSSVDCYVHVKGQASDPEDEDVPGVYLVTVDLDGHMPISPIDLEPTVDVKKALSDITQSVLDTFHEKIGIEVLDDFTITVYLESGVEIHQAFDTTQTNLVNGSNFHGKVDDEWVHPGFSNEAGPNEMVAGSDGRQMDSSNRLSVLWREIKSAALTPTIKQVEAYGRFVHTLSAASTIGAVSVAYSHKAVEWDSLVLVAWSVVLFITGAIMNKGE